MQCLCHITRKTIIYLQYSTLHIYTYWYIMDAKFHFGTTVMVLGQKWDSFESIGGAEFYVKQHGIFFGELELDKGRQVIV